MRILFTVICAVFIFNVYSQGIVVPGGDNVSKEDVKTMTADIVKNTPISKKELIAMIDKMIAAGQITKKDGEATKLMIQNMNEKDVAALKSTMVNMMGAKIDQMKLPKSKQ